MATSPPPSTPPATSPTPIQLSLRSLPHPRRKRPSNAGPRTRSLFQLVPAPRPNPLHPRHRRPLPPRLALDPPHPPRAVHGPPPRVVPLRPRRPLARHRFPARRLCRRAPHRAHGRASPLDVRHPHAAALRASRRAASPRPARAHHAPRPRSASAPPRPAQLRSLAGLARHPLAGHECRLPRLARPRRLRPRPRKRNHPRHGASLLPLHVAALLVDHLPPVARASPPRRLGLPPLPRPLRHRHDDALRLPHLLRPPRLPVLRRPPQPLRPARARRPGPRRSHHVGARLLRLPRPRHDH